jgi:tRNA (guanine37-N1)-methyltransferase
MDYSSFTVEEVLKQIFGPLGLEAPTSFETVDHIAHVNLRESHLPYKQLIAQVGLCVCGWVVLFFGGVYVDI